MIQPTIGRRVWFFPAPGTFGGSVFDVKQPCDAGIVFVHSSSVVNLDVADQAGYHWPIQHVRLLQDNDTPTPGQSYAMWMPYQVGQAAKQVQPAADANPPGASA